MREDAPCELNVHEPNAIEAVAEITGDPGPGPDREMCVRDPDGHGHMVAELWPGSIGGHPSPPGTLARLPARFHTSRGWVGIAGWVRR